MNAEARVYLDNAATSWPKPETVYQAVEQTMRDLGAPAGRGSYALAGHADSLVLQARQAVAELIGATEPKRILFGSNGSDVLNMALHGLLRPGDHVVTTVIEHNSVLRPLRFLEPQVSVTRVPCSAEGTVNPSSVAEALQPNTRAIVLNHASNVTGAIQPAAEIGRLAEQRGLFFLLDAAQTVGHFPLDVSELRCHLLAASGHKGLLGPLGTGVLYVAASVEQELAPFKQGGTGSQSDDDRQPETLPDKYEVGNLNVPALAGLKAGAAYLKERSLAAIREHELNLLETLLEGLQKLPGIAIYGPPQAAERVGVVSVNLDGWDPRELAAVLDSSFQIQTRAGFQCAPRMHRSLGTNTLGGTLRLSVGPFTSRGEIEHALAALRQIAAV